MRRIILYFLFLYLQTSIAYACKCYEENASLLDNSQGEVAFESEKLEFVSKVYSHNPFRHMYSWCVINHDKYRVAKVEWGDKSYREGITINRVNPGKCGVKRTGGKNYHTKSIPIKFGRLRADILDASEIETILPLRTDVTLRDGDLENLLNDYSKLEPVLREIGRIDLLGELNLELPVSEEINSLIRNDNIEYNAENYFQVNIVYLSSIGYISEVGEIRLSNKIFIEAELDKAIDVSNFYYLKVAQEVGGELIEQEIPFEKLIYPQIIFESQVEEESDLGISSVSIQLHHVNEYVHAAFGVESYFVRD